MNQNNNLIDLDLLKETIKKRGYRLDYVSQVLGLSYYGFSLKLNGKSEFKFSEILKLIEFLNLKEKEKNNIFFK